jgi:hypothetical protein
MRGVNHQTDHPFVLIEEQTRIGLAGHYNIRVTDDCLTPMAIIVLGSFALAVPRGWLWL